MHILVVGSGLCGLAAALLLVRDGHDVTVLDRDSAPLPASPEQAWHEWDRRGVAQFRQPHNFMPGLRLLLVNGSPVVEDDVLLTADEPALATAAARQARRLLARRGAR